MGELTFTATIDESRVIHLPADAPLGEVEVVVRESPAKGNAEAFLAAIRNLAPRSEDDRRFWREAREELFRDREAWDED